MYIGNNILICIGYAVVFTIYTKSKYVRTKWGWIWLWKGTLKKYILIKYKNFILC